MTNTDKKKLKKALALMQQAQELVNEVASKDEAFRYSANANFRSNRISAAVDILESEVKEFAQ